MRGGRSNDFGAGRALVAARTADLSWRELRRDERRQALREVEKKCCPSIRPIPMTLAG